MVLLGMLVTFTARAEAQPLRLRAEALAQTRSPVGLVVLSGEDRLRPWLDAEAVTWLGVASTANATTDPLAPTGDVLTVSVRARDVKSGSELRIGRMVVSMGAVRPLHLDGARGLVRVFGGTTLEAFGGSPVQRGFDYRTTDWAAGGRVGQAFGDGLAIGASYLFRTRDGESSDEELGADASFTPTPWLTAAGRASFDLLTRGPADVLGSVSVQKDDVRLEVFTTHRSPGRLLPATSLFSVLGDFAATSVGGTLRYRAFPRLELLGTALGQSQGDNLGGQGTVRATLALDDAFEGTLGLEARRVEIGASRWSGARGIVSMPLPRSFRLGTEVELVIPDEPNGRGSVWPWVLGALGYRPKPGWDVALGVEASSGPTYRAETHALARLSYAFERGSR